MTTRNPTPPGMNYQTNLGKALSGNPMPTSNIGHNKHKSVDDWLRTDHQRNEYQRDIEQIKRRMDRLHLWLWVASGLLALVFFMQQIIFFAKL